MIVVPALIGLFAGLQLASQAPVEPEPAPVVVVELFTSQGCPMCPDANRLLQELGSGDDVIAIAYGVSYWDMYGWEDRYAQPQFNDRQRAYVEAGEAQRVYTPQFVVNGSPQKLRFRPELIRAAVGEAARLTPLIRLQRLEDGRLAIALSGPEREVAAQVWLVGVDPDDTVMPISAGRNAGIDMLQSNMAVSLEQLADWPGGDYEVSAVGCPPVLACAVLVQAPAGGPVLSAALLRP